VQTSPVKPDPAQHGDGQSHRRVFPLLSINKAHFQARHRRDRLPLRQQRPVELFELMEINIVELKTE